MATCNTAQDFPGSRHSNRRSVAGGVVIVVLALASGALLLGPANSTAHKPDGDSSKLSLNTTAHGDSTGVEAEVLGEPYHFDHSIVNRQDLPDEPNPAPRAIAAYD
jgi:hypothetical protein